MSKPITKVAVRCPHCGADQLEPELAKSTFCRRCSQYFAISAAALVGASSPEARRTVDKPKPDPLAGLTRESAPSAQASGLKARFGDLLGTKPKHRMARCFECQATHEVSTTASSSTCKVCGAYIDLQDYRINGSFSRNIQTRGTVYLGSKGDLSSSKIVCSEATLHGKMRGNLHCDGPVTIRVQGRLFGTVEAGPVVIEKGSDVQFSRPLRATSLEVHGKMVGHVMSETHITISKSGSLEGDVTATGFTVEKGGLYEGALTITPRQAISTSPTQTAPPPDRRPSALDLGLLGGEQAPAHG